MKILKQIFFEFVTLSLKTLKRCQYDYPGLWQRASNQQAGLELFFRFNHFEASLRTGRYVVPTLDKMVSGHVDPKDLGKPIRFNIDDSEDILPASARKFKRIFKSEMVNNQKREEMNDEIYDEFADDQ